MRRLFGVVVMVIGVGCGVAITSSPPVFAGSWQQSAFPGKRVDTVATHPRSEDEIAASVEGRLYITHDGGLLWRDAALPSYARSIAFDPIRMGWIYCGTDQGLYVSKDAGVSWERMDSRMTAGMMIPTIVATGEYVFIDAHGTGGTATRVYRLSPDGVAAELGLNVENGNGLAYDPAHHVLFAGTRSGVYRSSDDGESWRPSGSGFGGFAFLLSVDWPNVWEVTDSKLYHSFDAGQTWSVATDLEYVGGRHYGPYLRSSGSILADHGPVYYGAYDPFYGTAVLAEFNGDRAIPALTARVNGLARSGPRLFAATADGIWTDDEPTSYGTAIPRPVVVIPGILGSLPTARSVTDHLVGVAKGIWGSTDTPSLLAIDPIRHTYDSLLKAFEDQGYRYGKDLFVFPYDWTQSNEATGRQLGQRLQQIRSICGCARVDVVAHSMGGLVARSYIEGLTYGEDINALVQVGTPNQGSAAAYPVWEAGQYPGVGADNGDGLLDMIGSILAGPHGASSKAEAVRRLVPSVGELLPVFDYIVGRVYPSGYPRNSYLESLNQSDRVALLHRVHVYTVASGSHATWRWLSVGSPHAHVPWTEGSLKSHTDGGGDGTVLQSSVAAITGLSALLHGDHGSIVGESAPTVLNILLGKKVYIAQENTTFSSGSNAIVAVSSTMRLVIHDTHGQAVSDSETTIPHAFYTGDATKLRLAMLPGLGGPYTITVSAMNADSIPEYRLVTGVVGDNQNDDPLFGPALRYGTERTDDLRSGAATYRYDPISGQLDRVQLRQDTLGMGPTLGASRPNLVAAAGDGDVPALVAESSASSAALPGRPATPRATIRSVGRALDVLKLTVWVCGVAGIWLVVRRRSR